jgi:hypothetical protein
VLRRCTVLGLTAIVVLLSVRTETAHAVLPINFIRGTVSGSGFVTAGPTTLTVGPDGRLYVADGSGKIQALTLDPNTKAVTAVQQITSATDLQEVYGIAFDPTDEPTSSPGCPYRIPDMRRTDWRSGPMAGCTSRRGARRTRAW